MVAFICLYLFITASIMYHRSCMSESAWTHFFLCIHHQETIYLDFYYIYFFSLFFHFFISAFLFIFFFFFYVVSVSLSASVRIIARIYEKSPHYLILLATLPGFQRLMRMLVGCRREEELIPGIWLIEIFIICSSLVCEKAPRPIFCSFLRRFKVVESREDY